MRFLFASGRAHLPEQVGGATRSAHTLLELLIAAGHDCDAIVGLTPGWRRHLVRGLRLFSAGKRFYLCDKKNGYLSYRTYGRFIARLTQQRICACRPDVVITQIDRAHAIAGVALDQGIPTLLYVHDVNFHRRHWPQPHPRLKFVSCSNFVAVRLRERLGFESTVIYPPIRLADYMAARRDPRFITLINPVPEKGLELALEIAALLPKRRFLFVESWPLKNQAQRALVERLRSFPNVTLMPATLNTAGLYSTTAVLIVPSQWEEGFARVTLEAQVNGIPVLGREVGGVREVLDASGTLLAPDASAQAWADAIEQLLTDDALYAVRSTEARANAARVEFNVDRLVEQFLSLAQEMV
jgi:glycosyltransferase involved in cell wall biosynthesis